MGANTKLMEESLEGKKEMEEEELKIHGNFIEISHAKVLPVSGYRFQMKVQLENSKIIPGDRENVNILCLYFIFIIFLLVK